MFEAMSPQHAIYIPAIALLGLIVGYILGARAARAEADRRSEQLKQ